TRTASRYPDLATGSAWEAGHRMSRRGSCMSAQARKDDVVKLQHGAYLEEYRLIRAEIVFNQTSARSVTSLTLSAIAILIVGASPILQARATTILLVAPLLFYALAWTQARFLYQAQLMGAYLRDTVIPGI